MTIFSLKSRKIRNREIVSKVIAESIYKKEILIIVFTLLVGIGCSSTPEEIAPSPVRETVQPKTEEGDLTEKEKQDIAIKIEKLKGPSVKDLIDNIKRTEGYERRQTWLVLKEILEQRLVVLLKKEFPDSKDLLDLQIYKPSGEETYFDLKLKDIFMIYFSQNPDNGTTVTKENLNLKRNKKEGTVGIFMHPVGMPRSQEATFKIFKGKLILSGYRIGMDKNPEGYEHVVSDVFAQLSLQASGFVPRLYYINQTVVDSIK